MSKLFYTLDQLNAYTENTLVSHLEMEFIELTEDYLIAKMPVCEKTFQPHKILHGGASIALAETVGGALSVAVTDPDKYAIRGITINANHVKAAREGFVFGKATFIHKGKTTHVVEIRITNEQDDLISVTRLTNYIGEQKQLNGK
jgi:1,4-dihydroxy-2-naphthoyl-CoA hydrolase